VAVEPETLSMIAGDAIPTGRRIVKVWLTVLSVSAGTPSAVRMEESTWSLLPLMTMLRTHALAHCDTP